MTSKLPRAKRIERLTKRPPIFRLIDDDDWPVIMVAYERGAFPFPAGMNAAELRSRIEAVAQAGYHVSVAEDENENFRLRRGLVGLVMTQFDGWTLKPEVFAFPWATRFNLLRGVVSFLLEMKRSREVGVCVVSCKQSSFKLMERMTELKLLFRCGYIPNGYHDSALWLFNIAGKKQKVG